MRYSSYKFVKLIQPNIKIFLQQHCEYIWGNSLYMRVVHIETFNNQQMIVII